MGKSIRVIATVLLFATVVGCGRYVDSRNPVRSLPDGGPVPINLLARVNNTGSVTVSWEVSDSARVARFRIYVSDSTGSNYVLRDSTTGYGITIDGLLINQRYFFKVAAVMGGGLQGELSEAVSAKVMYLSITIQNDRKYTNTRDVQVRINSPPTETSHLMLSEDPTFADAVYVPLTGMQASFTLSEGDGVKTVYVRLQFSDGSQSGELLFDDIILDTHARIDSVFFTPSGVTFSAGETITFGLDASETGGDASVSFTGMTGMEKVSLFDDGTNGDLDAGDGVYLGYWVVPTTFALYNGHVTGSFTDAATNRASQITSQHLLNINSAPQPVELVAVVQSDTVDFTWTASSEQDFASYRLYRDISASVDTSDVLIALETSQNTVTFNYVLPDTGTYYFRVFVFDEHGLFAGSNVVIVAP